jgi:hypothetical protein
VIARLPVQVSLNDTIITKNFKHSSRPMTPTEFDLTTLDGYTDWLATEIPRLGSQAQATTSIICNAWGKVLGTYIFEYDGQTFRLPREEAFAFLTFILSQGKMPLPQ